MLLLFACSNAPKVQTELQFVDPASIGPYSVATRESQFINSNHITIPLQVWYPTTSTSTTFHKYGNLLDGSALDGGGVDCTEDRPVVIFSHGNSGMRFQSIFLTEYLASHGFIVVAPDHVGNTIFDNDDSRKPELIIRRPQDISESFDWLLEDSELGGCIIPDDGFAVIGHSFGGYTALAISGAYLDTDKTLEHCSQYGGWLCEYVEHIAEYEGSGIYDYSDSRVWASIPMTPAALETLVGGLDSVQVPTFVIAGSKDNITSYDGVVKPIYDRLNLDNKRLLTVQNAGHYSFTNACDLINTYPDCGEGFLPVSQAHQLMNTTTTAFLQSIRGMNGMDESFPYDDEMLVWE